MQRKGLSLFEHIVLSLLSYLFSSCMTFLCKCHSFDSCFIYNLYELYRHYTDYALRKCKSEIAFVIFVDQNTR